MIIHKDTRKLTFEAQDNLDENTLETMYQAYGKAMSIKKIYLGILKELSV